MEFFDSEPTTTTTNSSNVNIANSFFIIKKEPNVSIVKPIDLPLVNVENIVFVCTIGTPINLRYFCNKVRDWAPQYNPKRFSAAIIRFRNPTKIAVLLFDSGKIVCTGAKNEPQAIYIMKLFIERVKSIGYRKYVNFDEFKIVNIVASSHLAYNINIQQMLEENTDCCTYEKDEFPGLIMKHPSIKPITLLIFQSGEIVITGAKQFEVARDALYKIYYLIYNYKTDMKQRKPISPIV